MSDPILGQRKLVFTRYIVKTPTVGTKDGIDVSGWIFNSRLGSGTIYENVSGGVDISGNNGTEYTILDVSGAYEVMGGSNNAYVVSSNLYFLDYNSELISNNNAIVQYNTIQQTANKIRYTLETINSNSVNSHVFFDSIFYFLKRSDVTTNSVQIDNQSVVSYYGGTTGLTDAKIYYYKSGLSYSYFKTEIEANETATDTFNTAYHALPMIRSNEVRNSGPEPFHISGSTSYDISSNVVGQVGFKPSGSYEQIISVDGDMNFGDFFLTLKYAPEFGFPLFTYGVESTPATLAPVPCLLKGTRVLTPGGYKKIESLAVNDIISNHYNEPIKIRKISKTVVKWSENPTLDKKVFKTPGYQPTYLTGWHRIRRQDGSFLQAYDCGFPVAKKEEICESGDTFTIYHLNVDDWKNNHLVVNGGTVVESWSGINK